MPRHAKNKQGAERLLRTIGSVGGQQAMNEAKGSLSARADVLPPGDPILREMHRLLQKGPLVLALSGIAPPRFAADLERGLAEMIAPRDVEPAVQTLRSRYALLK